MKSTRLHIPRYTAVLSLLVSMSDFCFFKKSLDLDSSAKCHLLEYLWSLALPLSTWGEAARYWQQYGNHIRGNTFLKLVCLQWFGLWRLTVSTETMSFSGLSPSAEFAVSRRKYSWAKYGVTCKAQEELYKVLSPLPPMECISFFLRLPDRN